jgi:Arc/MetJ-type ribon-helix-helix transcriptional regulator
MGRLTNSIGEGTVGIMTITIPEELDEFVRAKLLAGGFESPSAVVAAALTAWQGQELYATLDRDEVEQLLLQAIDSPRIPWNEEGAGSVHAGHYRKGPRHV